jgi:hypothetical protein
MAEQRDSHSSRGARRGRYEHMVTRWTHKRVLTHTRRWRWKAATVALVVMASLSLLRTCDGASTQTTAHGTRAAAYGTAQVVRAARPTLTPPASGVALQSALRPPARPTVTLFGSAGSFGQLQAASRVPTGQTLATNPVPGWGFQPGQSAYFAAVGPDGSVFVANEPQTDNQLAPTAVGMTTAIFDPAARTFRNVAIPTSANGTTATDPGTNPPDVVGGADVSDLQPMTVNGVTRIAFLSDVPYHGWNVNDGFYPTFGYFKKSGGTWAFDPASAKTAQDIQRSGSAGLSGACRTLRNSSAQSFTDCRGTAEMAVLPRSQNLVITQYFEDPARHQASGGLMVIDPSGRLLAWYAYPNISRPDGATLSVHPREVETDPTSLPGDERFAVVFDVFSATGQIQPFTLQEFSFRAGQVTPVSAPILSGDNSGASAVGFETVHYDYEGNLWAAQARNGTLTGGSLALYRKINGARRTTTACGTRPDWSQTQWSLRCPPDQEFARAASLGVARSLTEDPNTHAILLATLSGDVLAIVSTGEAGSYAVKPVIDLGLDQLVDRSRYWVGPRKGAVDGNSRSLWLPIQQLQSPTICPTYPCLPKALDQWLARVDLTQALR